MRTSLLLACLLVACAHQPPVASQHGNHRFDDADAWAARFEGPGRDAWQKPEQVLELLELSPDAKVADIGAATGYFPVRVARAVPQGDVYAVDIESAMVEYLARRARREGVSNLTAILAAPDDPRLPEAVDVVMVVNTYHHIEARPEYFRRLVAKVKPRGRLVIIDFSKRSTMGPPASSKLTPEEVERELSGAGWTLAASHDILPEQYFLVFQRS